MSPPADDDDHDAKLDALFGAAGRPALKSWLEAVRGFAKDGQGRRVILGLTAEKTLEFVTLDPLHWAERDTVRTRGIPRYKSLREKHDAARMQDVAENLALNIKPTCQPDI